MLHHGWYVSTKGLGGNAHEMGVLQELRDSLQLVTQRVADGNIHFTQSELDAFAVASAEFLDMRQHLPERSSWEVVKF